jgi:predicted AlkP superfamily phosphohydrolase/phosphomutase
MSGRVLAVVLHGFGPYYLDPLLEGGRMPNLRAILDAGTHGRLQAPFPISAATWVTMFTGQSTGVHGALDYVQVDARSYHGTYAELADNAEFRDNTLFSIASRHGRKVASLFLPMTYPPWKVNGIMVPGFPVPDDRRAETYPPELGDELGQIAPTRLMHLRYEDKDAVADYLQATLARLEEITISAWRDGDFDLMYTCIPVPDLAHHYFWDRDNPAAMERLYRTYESVDATVGRYAEMVDEDTHLVVFSDHGGGPAPRRRFNVNVWLAEEGLLQVRSSLVYRLGLADATNALLQQFRRFRLHQKLRPVIRGRVRQGVLSLTHNDIFFDWSRTSAYGVEFFYPLVGVEINLEGRQQRGFVKPGAEYEALRDRLIARLGDLVDPSTGRKACQRVCRREEMFHGPYLERIPDIVAVLDDDFDGKIQLGADIFADNELQWEYPFMGYHSREAFFAARGPGIAPGDRLEEASMIDLAPTLLDLLGVPIPDSMEGKPLAL